MTLLAFAILDSFFPLADSVIRDGELRDEQTPAIEMNYIIVVMIFPKNLPTVTFFTSPCLCVCVCALSRICVLSYFMKMWK